MSKKKLNEVLGLNGLGYASDKEKLDGIFLNLTFRCSASIIKENKVDSKSNSCPLSKYIFQ